MRGAAKNVVRNEKLNHYQRSFNEKKNQFFRAGYCAAANRLVTEFENMQKKTETRGPRYSYLSFCEALSRCGVFSNGRACAVPGFFSPAVMGVTGTEKDDRGSGSSSPGLVRLQTQGVHRARHQRSGHLEHHAAPFPLIRKRAVEDIVESAEPGGKSGELHDALHSARHVEIGGRPFIPAHFRVGRAGNFRRPCPDACSTVCGGRAGTAGCGLI